jgi:hypothetical protein
VGTRARALAVSVVKVETPYRDFLAFWARAEHAPRDEQKQLWRELYAERHPGVMEHYLRLFGDAGSLDDALGRYAEVVGTFDERFAALALEQRAGKVAELLRAPETPRAVALVGLFTADAWSDDLDGSPVAFFALERMPLGSSVVATHEFAHASHRLARDEYWDIEPGLVLLCEGVALTTTRRLHPDAPLEEHFIVEDYAAYEAAVDADWQHAVDALLACLDSRDLRDLQRCFWPDWGRADHDVPERVGYLVGARIVDLLLGGHDLATIVRWPAERVLPEVRAALEALRAAR